MKVILSRKGFDSSNGGCASPILPDGTMLSLPIPDNSYLKYSDVTFGGNEYSDIISKLKNNKFNEETCHLDPDIRPDLRVIEEWKPAFGQTGSAQAQLRNADVTEGDIFLFFGWFRRVDDNFHFIKKKDDKCFFNYADLHAIYGYMQIGKIITSPEEIKKYRWHPHSEDGYGKNNTLYIPSEKLIIDGENYGPGYGTFSYNKNLVLTKEGCSRSNWIYHEFLSPEKVYGNRKNSSKNNDTLSYRGIWQELIVDSTNNPGLLNWVIDDIIQAN